MRRNSCFNCGLSSYRVKRYKLGDMATKILQRLQQWHPQCPLISEDFVCNKCVIAVQKSLDKTETSQPQFGHQRVCFQCGRSTLRIRSNALPINSPERSLLERRIAPRQLAQEARVCYACWVALRRSIKRGAIADANRQDNISEYGASTSAQVAEQPVPKQEEVVPKQEETVPPQEEIVPQQEKNVPQQEEIVPQVSPSISYVTEKSIVADKMVLPNYRRAAATTRWCFYPNCIHSERLRVPKSIRLRMLSDFKIYIPTTARICTAHIRCYNWEGLQDQNNFISTFNVKQIENMLNLMSELRHGFKLDFENIEEWSPHLCRYWLGYTPEEILELLNQCPSLTSFPKAKTMLCIYLLKLQTRDTNSRLSSLLQIPVATLVRYMKKARQVLSNRFAPHHPEL